MLNFRGHRVVLAAGSKFFFDFFQENENKVPLECIVPSPIETTYKIVEDPLHTILAYLYHNQVSK